MNAPMVAIAVSSTMLTSPISSRAAEDGAAGDQFAAAAAGAGQQVADVAVELAPHAHAAEHQVEERHRDHPHEEQRHGQHQRDLQHAPRIEPPDLHARAHRAPCAACPPGCGPAGRVDGASDAGALRRRLARAVPRRAGQVGQLAGVRLGTRGLGARRARDARRSAFGTRPVAPGVVTPGRIAVPRRRRRRGSGGTTGDEPVQPGVGARRMPAAEPARPPSAPSRGTRSRPGPCLDRAARAAPLPTRSAGRCAPAHLGAGRRRASAPDEPLALPGPSPVRGSPGSFGELTYCSLVQTVCRCDR